MVVFASLLLAVLSIWDYPPRQVRHEQLRDQFVAAVRDGDTKTMIETSRKGVALLPDDPTWHYNLACSLAYLKNHAQAFDELEKAIDLGFRDVEVIRKDSDLKRLSGERRFAELIEYAKEMQTRPLMVGPLATVEATGVSGQQMALGAQNLRWDFDVGCFAAQMKLAAGASGGNAGDLYMNRDGGHSLLVVTNYPGLTRVKLDAEGESRRMGLDFPDILFPYPVFGNCSRALTMGPFWRSLPRAMMTTDAARTIGRMTKFYLSNQVWVFPANADCPPVGTNNDVFASVAPYWLTTAGRSWSDLPYLQAALEVSRTLRPEVKKSVVSEGMLAPIVQTLIRKSLKGVENEDDYLTAKAHPTALPPNGLDLPRLKKLAAELTAEAVPPLAVISVVPHPLSEQPAWPELTYRSPFAWAYVLRAEADERKFTVNAAGLQGCEFAFSCVHDDLGAAKVERLGRDAALVTLDRTKMSPTNRVDIAVFARKKGKTGWGAPSFVSFAVVDPNAPYSDPALTPLAPPPAKLPERKEGDDVPSA